MTSSTVPVQTLDLYCPESDFRHSEIRLTNPDWLKCLYCNTRFSVGDRPSFQAVATSAAVQRTAAPPGPLTPQTRQTPTPAAVGPLLQPAAASVSPPSARALTGAPFRPAVLRHDRQLGQSHVAQPTTATNIALPTHVPYQPKLSLKYASGVGVQKRADSLENLKRDKEAFSRQPEVRNVMVSLHFFLALYRNEIINHGRPPVKVMTKIHPAGRTEATPVPIGVPHSNQAAMIHDLVARFWIAPEITACIDVEALELCTTIDSGTQARPATWVRMPRDPASSLSLVDYKDQVHDADGRELDTKRAPYIQKGKNSKNKVLGVFLVQEEEAREAGTRVNFRPPALTISQTALSRRQGKPPGASDTKPLAPRPTSPSVSRDSPSAGSDTDDSCIFMRQVSTPGEPEPDAGLRRRIGSVGVPASPNTTASGTAWSTTALSRPGPSTITTPRSTLFGTALSSTALSTTALRSLSSTALSTTALRSPTVAGDLLRGLEEEEDAIFGGCTPSVPSPNPWQDGSIPDVSDDQQEEFVRPADLDLGTPRAQGDGSPKRSRAGPIEEVEDDIVVEVVGNKRKRTKPGSVKPNGAPKYSTRASKQPNTSASTAPTEHQALAATRHSGRLQARGVGTFAR